MTIRFTSDIDLPLSNCPDGPTRAFAAGETVEISSIQDSVPLEEGQEPTSDFYFYGLCYALGVPKNLFTIIQH